MAFKTTPKMSTYLIAFIVSEFECTDIKKADDGTPTSVCGRPGTKETLSNALKAGIEALNTMKTFTNIAYGALGNKKMTQAAIPDFATGAMENWGLATYRSSPKSNFLPLKVVITEKRILYGTKTSRQTIIKKLSIPQSLMNWPISGLEITSL